jgi:hypothetical protein
VISGPVVFGDGSAIITEEKSKKEIMQLKLPVMYKSFFQSQQMDFTVLHPGYQSAHLAIAISFLTAGFTYSFQSATL